MKALNTILIVTAWVVLAFSFKQKTVVTEGKPASIPGSYAPVAVLELFTSEGCSSCPAADDILPQLARRDDNIIPLSFHVDYWNRLGWTDPFSSAVYTERQKLYADEFNVESIYTPQLVINGVYELVGSSQALAETLIKKALTEKKSVELSIEEVKKEIGKINFIVKADGNLKGSQLMTALVQKTAVTQVKAGENDGRKLSHTNVVRSFSIQTLSKKMKIELPFPGNIDEDNWELIVYASENDHLKILGAAKFDPK
jgi:hypothetical protein